MKLISLNAWGGRALEALLQFLEDEAPTTDMFCFQEIYATGSEIRTYEGARLDLLDLLRDTLRDFESAYAPMVVGALDEQHPVSFDLSDGLATFTRRSLPVIDQIVVPVRREIYGPPGNRSELTRSFQVTTVASGGRQLHVVNVHGIAQPGHKLDTADRLEYSRAVVDFLGGRDGDVVVCGDFNLLPETRSIGILEGQLRNLVQDFGVATTRSRLNIYFGTPQAQDFSDYVFVSSNLVVHDFRLPNVEASDHLPLILEFDWDVDD